MSNPEQKEQPTSAATQAYFDSLKQQVYDLHAFAGEARKKSVDPEDVVEVSIAKDMAERVEGIISIAAPQIVGKGIPKRIKELEEQYGVLDFRIPFKIAGEVALGDFCTFDDKLEAIKTGVRVGFAYLTLGIVSSPIEGLVEMKLKKRKDGKEYLAMYFAGPVRSAGGTNGAMAVLVADYVRKLFDIDAYDPTEDEINRFVIELDDYHDRVTNLQYKPSEEEVRFLAKNLPVEVDGDPTDQREVSNFKNLPRIETNMIRGGVSLVVGEMLAQKAAKIWKKIGKWAKEFNLDTWFFLEEFITIQKKAKASTEKEGTTKEKEDEVKIPPDFTYIKDIVAGRPVFGHPSKHGGLRLRYGRARTSGYSSAAVNPATMIISYNFIGYGIQLKAERPFKGCTLSSCDSIDGPIVLLESGEVRRVNTMEEARKCLKQVKEVLYFGDILINYGDFFDRAHTLVPPGYCEEWWVQEMEKAIVDHFGNLDLEKTAEHTGIDVERLEVLSSDFFYTKPTVHEALQLGLSLQVPLHPRYTYHYDTLNKEQLLALLRSCAQAKVFSEQDNAQTIIKVVLPYSSEVKRSFELLGIPHLSTQEEYIIVEKEHAHALFHTLNIENVAAHIETISAEETNLGVDLVNTISPFTIRDKSGFFIGARLAKPEKGKQRKLTGSPHGLFPVGEQGGRMRSFQSVLEKGYVDADFALYYDDDEQMQLPMRLSPFTNKPTRKQWYSRKQRKIVDTNEEKEGDVLFDATTYRLDFTKLFRQTLKNLEMRVYPDLIKGVRGTMNKTHMPEHMAKAILRAKHEVFVNKDGTTRFDMMQMPITHFKPKEVGTSVKRLRELGYLKDIHGKDLTQEDQVLELRTQDMVVPRCKHAAEEGADTVLFNVCNFMDEMLVKLYGVEPFYNLKSPDDLVGHLVVALAPHTAAGSIARIIGFSDTQMFLAHPMIHAGTRRDCDGDEASISMLLDNFLNFSRSFLASTRGSTQDACLVVTYNLIPAEVDDMILNLDIAWKYPLAFYEACVAYKKPWDVKIPILDHVVNTPKQFEGYGFTHPTDNLNKAIVYTAYKIIPTMQEKVALKLDLAKKLRAVDAADVARLIVERHFIRDIKGNLRKFSLQKFRCVQCNAKYRRPPLKGICVQPNCHGKIIYTISEGSIIKYLRQSIDLTEEYKTSDYLKQTIKILEEQIDSLFGLEAPKQMSLQGFLKS